MIKHIWFDFSGTLTVLDPVSHDKLRYGAYAEIVKKPISQELMKEYEKVLAKQGSNSAVFRSLGLPADFWGRKVEYSYFEGIYRLIDKSVLKVLPKLKLLVPISLFTNIKAKKVLEVLGIEGKWFTYILEAGDYKEPKPALDGFKKMVELSTLPASEILYVGDSVVKDIRPAKSLGITTCMLWGQSPEADWSCEKFEDLLEIIK